jgi:hypothetical protein
MRDGSHSDAGAWMQPLRWLLVWQRCEKNCGTVRHSSCLIKPSGGLQCRIRVVCTAKPRKLSNIRLALVHPGLRRAPADSVPRCVDGCTCEP